MMKRRLPVLTSFLVLLLIFQSGCAAATDTPLQQPPGEPTVTVTTSDGPPAVQVTETGTVPEGTPSPEAVVEVTLTGEATPFEEQPPLLVTPPDKPSLSITDEQESLAAASVVSAHVIGFVFPDGPVAMKAAAATNPTLIQDGLTEIGVVQVGPEAELIEPGTHVIAIDLESTEPQVRGRVIRGDSERDLMFERTALVRNPARQDSPAFPAISPIISSYDVCFVVGQPATLEKGVQAQPEISWFRYCSLNSLDTDQPILSVQANFPSRFETVVARLGESLRRLEAAGFPPSGELDYGRTISEMEGHPNLISCNESNECTADISGAPSAGFWSDYDIARDAAGGGDFAVTAGIVRVERDLDVPGQELVVPGDYWVRVWFDGKETFLGSTLLGVTDDGDVVPGQTIPSTPAYFLDAGTPRPVVSWISAWRLCNWCMWQSNCP